MFHSSKVEFIPSFFGGDVSLKKSFHLCLTFSETANVQSDKELRAITSDNKLVNKHINQPRSYQLFYVHCALYALVLGGLANSLNGL